MPIIKSAIKKQRQDRHRTALNSIAKNDYKRAIRTFKKKATLENLKKAYSKIDKAAKKHILHGNKAARIKSSLATRLTDKPKKSDSPTSIAKSGKKVRKANPVKTRRKA